MTPNEIKLSTCAALGSHYAKRNRAFVVIIVAVVLLVALAITVSHLSPPISSQAVQAIKFDSNAKSDHACTAGNSCATQAASKQRMGLVLRPFDAVPQVTEATHEGILIEVAKGRSGMAGIRRGDVLVAVNGVAVKTFRDARDAIKRSQGSATLAVKRGVATLTFQIPLS